MTLQVAKTFLELISKAKEAEENGETDNATMLYERALKKEPHNELPYNRLMVLYSKEKNYEDELKILNKGIRAFEEFYQKRTDKIIGKNKKASQLSNALAKSLGQKDKKGNAVNYPQPIPKWIKRREQVEKKLGIK